MRDDFPGSRIRLLLCLALALAAAGCSGLATPAKTDPFRLPGNYISQQQIVLQGFSTVLTVRGPQAAVYFGYDRDKRHARLGDLTWVAVDLVEFKALEAGSTWRWEPFVVVSDDDFDGYADRLFMDADFTGTLESIFDISPRKLAMDKIGLGEINPWLLPSAQTVHGQPR